MITVDSLSFGYEPSEVIIDALDWRFSPGAVTAVTGPSGRGKSTLLYLLGLLLTPWSGSIKIDDVDVVSWGDPRRSLFRAERVGFVFQDAALDSTRTVLDNVIESSVYNSMSQRDATKRARRLMERFGVALRADHKPGEVSGGQAQRIALCRALLAEPDVVLADEPTGNLDVDSADVVIDAFMALAHDEQRTVVVATHDPTIVAACDQVLAL